MGHGKAAVMLITALLVGIIGLGYLAEEPEEIVEATQRVPGLSLLVFSGQGQEEIRLWDNDVTMGNPHNRQLRDGNMVYAQRPHLWSPKDSPWYSALYRKEAFRERVV